MKNGLKDEEAEYGQYNGPGGPVGQDVMWEVGSDSDSEDGKGDETKRVVKKDERATTEEPEDAPTERRGVGGGQDGRGERRGLLGEEEEIDDDIVYVQPGPSR